MKSKGNWSRKSYLIILLIGIVATVPLHIHGLFLSHDFNIHFKWSYLFAEQLLSGELYPRWLSEDFAGFGSPVFFYYGPVPFYFSSFFYLLLHKLTPLWIPLTISASVSIIISGFSANAWLRSFASPRASLVGAVLYMVLPYHFGIDLYTRFAYAECWAFVWMPPILLYTSKIAKEDFLTGIIGVGAFLSLLLMTHLPSTLIFLPFPILYILFFNKKIKALKGIFIAYLIGFGISSIYWIPAVSYQEYASFEALLEYFWRDNFLFSNPENVHINTSLWYYLNISTLITLIIALILLFQSKFYSNFNRKEYWFWGGLLILTFLMSTPLSIPIWSIFKPLQGIGFPWRFLSLFSLFFAAIVSFYLTIRENVPPKKPVRHQFRLKLAFTLCILLITSNIVFVYYKVNKSKKFVEHHNIPLLRERLIASFEPAEHIPANANIEKSSLVHKTSLIEVIEGNCEIIILKKQPRFIKFEVNSTLYPSKIRVNQFSFPGWELYSNSERSKDLKLKTDSKTGMMFIEIPKGKYVITLTLESLKIEIISLSISIFFIVTFLLIILYKKLSK